MIVEARASDRQTAAGTERRSNSRAARPASAIKTQSQVNERPPGGGAAAVPEAPPGAPGTEETPDARGEAGQSKESAGAAICAGSRRRIAARPPVGETSGTRAENGCEAWSR